MDDDLIREILTTTRRIAVVGASNKPDRPSFEVMRFLIAQGFEVVPVNPGLAGTEILGRRVAPSLAEAGALDMVDVFRKSSEVGEVVNEAVRLGARTIWMQLGVVNDAAAAVARAAGVLVVMDRYPVIEMGRLGIGGGVG